jgi:magnesium chelatase family protein
MHTFSRVYSAQPHYLKGHIVTVEVDISPGVYAFTIVGLPGQAVEEARDRVGSAIKNSGYTSPKTKNHKLVVSLAPAELKKHGSYFDVAIALGYLLSRREVSFDPRKKLFLGELALNGDVLPVRGVLPLVQAAREAGFTEIYVPRENAEEAALVENILIFPVTSLIQLIEHIDEGYIIENNQGSRIQPQPQTNISVYTQYQPSVDFSDVRGQEIAKRGLEIAAAGGHNIAMYGPPGTGKTTLAKAFIDILPPLDTDEALEVTGIHSVAGTLQNKVITKPPFRSPHHTASYVSVIGGSSRPKPGEVTLAHRGVLFMDEFPEFEVQVLESLRQPLEDREVNISRASGTATFPTDFILVAAMNPPPPDATPYEIARYKRRISGPIMDRIDMWVPVELIPYEKLSDSNFKKGEESIDIQKRVLRARDLQKKRFASKGSRAKRNAHMSIKDLEIISLTHDVKQTLNTSAKKLDLSPRSYHRMIKLARTIADLEESPEITKVHMLEALQYRPRE